MAPQLRRGGAPGALAGDAAEGQEADGLGALRPARQRREGQGGLWRDKGTAFEVASLAVLVIKHGLHKLYCRRWLAAQPALAWAPGQEGQEQQQHQRSCRQRQRGAGWERQQGSDQSRRGCGLHSKLHFVVSALLLRHTWRQLQQPMPLITCYSLKPPRMPPTIAPTGVEEEEGAGSGSGDGPGEALSTPSTSPKPGLMVENFRSPATGFGVADSSVVFRKVRSPRPRVLWPM